MASLMDLIMQQSMGGMTPQGGIPTPSAPAMPVAPRVPITPERQQMFDVLSSYGAQAPVAPPPAPPMRPMPMLLGQPMPSMAPAPMMPPMPPPRPAAEPVGAPMQLAGGQPSVRQSFMQRLLGGPDYQSNNMPVVMSPQGPTASGGFLPQSVNWGDPESAADFFRADAAARQLGLLG
jgi:hypothetical protein